MALLYPIQGGYESQLFGPSHLGVEPAMYADRDRAWWNPFPGSTPYADFHGALDIAAASGTPILASEAGTVIESYFDNVNGGGNKVRIQIRPDVSYCHNHMLKRMVGVGAQVARGQTIGQVGTTGYSTGNHTHFWVGIDDTVGSDTWPTLYNPKLFLPGGRLANDSRILPLNVIRYVRLNGPSINIRTTPDLDVGASNVFATSSADGIYRGGRKIGALNHKFKFVRKVATDDGEFFEVTAFRRRLFIFATLAHFVA